MQPSVEEKTFRGSSGADNECYAGETVYSFLAFSGLHKRTKCSSFKLWPKLQHSSISDSFLEQCVELFF